MPERAPHITVCICTCRRPALLEGLLHRLAALETGNCFSYSVTIADNDLRQSARETAENFIRTSPIRAVYCSEPKPNIAAARNKALEHAEGDYVAFIDDDEIPEPAWLRLMLETCNATGADGVLGPVLPRFDHDPPPWIVKGRFFERRRLPTGSVLHWSQTRTGNVLFRRNMLDRSAPAFRVQFATGGEDVDFFRRMAEKGRKFVWCDEAPVYELVPPSRCTPMYLLRRSVIRAANLPKISPVRPRNVAKSMAAMALYFLALPFLAMGGRHLLMMYLEKMSYHGAYLLSTMGITPDLRRG